MPPTPLFKPHDIPGHRPGPPRRDRYTSLTRNGWHALQPVGADSFDLQAMQEEGPYGVVGNNVDGWSVCDAAGRLLDTMRPYPEACKAMDAADGYRAGNLS